MLEVVKDNGLLNKPVVHAQTILRQKNLNDCINLKIGLSSMYLNKMIVIDMTDTYYAMHIRICWLLTSKRTERHTLL